MEARLQRDHAACGNRCTSPGPHAGERFRPTWARTWRTGPRFLHDATAVSPVIATVLILSISAVGIGAVLSWGLPSVQQTQAETEIEGVLDQFFAFDQVAESVLHGGAVGKASEVAISFPTGEVQRTVDSTFVVTWYPALDGINAARFVVRGLDDGTPNTIELVALGGLDTSSLRAEVNRTEGKTNTQIGITNFQGVAVLPLDIVGASGVGAHVPTKIVVLDASDRIIMETWILPAGTLQYTRNAPFGMVGIRLENSCVITEYETGPFIHNKPLAVVDRDTPGDPIFAALFQQILVDNASFPGAQAAGAGSFPLLFSLQQNHLRAPGDPVVAVHLNVTGSLAVLWKQYYVDTYGYTFSDPANRQTSYLTLDAAAGKPYDFVLMENRIEVTMKPSTSYLGPGSAGQ